MSGSGKFYGVIRVACSGRLIVQDGTTTGCKRYDSMEGIGRVESGTETESDTGVKADIQYGGVCSTNGFI